MKLPKLPIPSHETHSVWDSSKLSDYFTCERLFLFRHLLGLSPANPNHNLIFGSAWHAAREVLLRANYALDSIEPAYSAFLEVYREYFPSETDFDFNGKSPQNVLLALNQLCNDPSERVHEIISTETYGEVLLDPEQNISLVYKMDAILRDSSGKVFSHEYKSGSYKFAWWLDEKRVRFQIKCYNHALFSMFPANEVRGVLVKGTLFRKNDIENVPVLVRSTPLELEDWRNRAMYRIENLLRDFEKLSTSSPSTETLDCFHKNEESCIKYNKMCPMYNVCWSQINPLRFADRLPVGFKREFWDPRRKES